MLECAAAERRQRRAFAQQVADTARVGAEANGIEPRHAREISDERRVEYPNVRITLDVRRQREIAGRRSCPAVVRETVSRPDKQEMSARRNDRAVWNRADENWRCIAVSSHLEQSITGRRIRSRDRQRRVAVVVNLDEVVACSSRSRSSYFGNQERACGVALLDCSDGSATSCDDRIRRVRQVELKGFSGPSPATLSASMSTVTVLNCSPAAKFSVVRGTAV